MICGVVATSISGCGVFTVCRVVCGSVAHYTAHCTHITALARLSIRSLRMVQLDRNM